MKAFLKRNPEVSERVGEPLGKERAMVTVQKLERWFQNFEQYMKSTEVKDGKSVLADSRRLFNCDESGFPLAGKQEKVLAPTGSKNVYSFSNSDKRQITVLACINADGLFLPPMLIFPNSRFRYNPLDGAPQDWFIGRSKNGWINSEVFYEWVCNHFVPQVKKNNVPLPVVLFVDGHQSHLSYETAEFCSQNQVILYCLPSHASHIIQPCDLTLFKSLKENWKKEVRKWKAEHITQNVTKLNFASVFAQAWQASSKKSIAENGFRASGLYPLNAKMFDREKLAPSQLFTSRQTEPNNVATANVPSTSTGQ